MWLSFLVPWRQIKLTFLGWKFDHTLLHSTGCGKNPAQALNGDFQYEKLERIALLTVPNTTFHQFVHMLALPLPDYYTILKSCFQHQQIFKTMTKIVSIFYVRMKGLRQKGLSVTIIFTGMVKKTPDTIKQDSIYRAYRRSGAYKHKGLNPLGPRHPTWNYSELKNNPVEIDD